MMSSPIFNGTNGEAHKTQHITARKVVEVNSFFIPQQLTRTNVRKELYLLSLTEAFFAEGIEKKRRRCSKIRIGLREHFLPLPGSAPSPGSAPKSKTSWEKARKQPKIQTLKTRHNP